jgi:hypothetical protein
MKGEEKWKEKLVLFREVFVALLSEKVTILQKSLLTA